MGLQICPDRPQDGRLTPYEDIEDVFERYKGKEAEIFQGVCSLYQRIAVDDSAAGKEAGKPEDGDSEAPGR